MARWTPIIRSQVVKMRLRRVLQRRPGALPNPGIQLVTVRGRVAAAVRAGRWRESAARRAAEAEETLEGAGARNELLLDAGNTVRPTVAAAAEMLHDLIATQTAAETAVETVLAPRTRANDLRWTVP